MTLVRVPMRAATGGWWLLLLVDALSVVVGIVVLAKPGNSLSTLAVIAGIFLLVDGILELAASLMYSTQSREMIALLGVLTAIVGVLLIRHPIPGSHRHRADDRDLADCGRGRPESSPPSRSTCTAVGASSSAPSR